MELHQVLPGESEDNYKHMFRWCSFELIKPATDFADIGYYIRRYLSSLT